MKVEERKLERGSSWLIILSLIRPPIDKKTSHNAFLGDLSSVGSGSEDDEEEEEEEGTRGVEEMIDLEEIETGP